MSERDDAAGAAVMEAIAIAVAIGIAILLGVFLALLFEGRM